jgi:hypothetical protein
VLSLLNIRKYVDINTVVKETCYCCKGVGTVPCMGRDARVLEHEKYTFAGTAIKGCMYCSGEGEGYRVKGRIGLVPYWDLIFKKEM